VLLLDLAMPHKDGWEVLEALAGDEATRHVPVVMMTGSASQENLDRADRAGVLDFIGKPFEPSELIGIVNRVLEMTEEREVVGDLG
jgi:CheY-like chemotaxis protein